MRTTTAYSTRIIVAGGGGSSGCYTNAGLGGHAGGIRGETGKSNRGESSAGGTGGTKSSGNSLLYGGAGGNGDEAGGSGGGGYYGGYGGATGAGGTSGAGGGGGSSYISGYQNCAKYNGYVFTNTTMIPGYQQMPYATSLTSFETTGHSGNGYARITRIKNNYYATCHRKYSKSEIKWISLTVIFAK